MLSFSLRESHKSSWIIFPMLLFVALVVRCSSAADSAAARLAARVAAEAAISKVQESLADERYDDAVAAAREAVTVAKGVKSSDLIARAAAASKHAQDLRAAYRRLATSVQKLLADPQDKDANLRIGRFLCFEADNWEKGLPHLAKGSDAELLALAEAEAADPREVADRVKLGDEWWDRARAEKDKSVTTRERERSAYWYALARPEADAATALRLRTRIAIVHPTVDLLNGSVNAESTPVYNWKKSDHGTWMSFSKDREVMLAFDYVPWTDYDEVIELEFVSDKSMFLKVGLPQSDVLLTFTLSRGSTFIAAENVDYVRSAPGRRSSTPLTSQRQYTLVLKVRRAGVQALLDGKPVVELLRSDFRTRGNQNLGDLWPKNLYVQGADGAVLHSVRVMEVVDPDPK